MKTNNKIILKKLACTISKVNDLEDLEKIPGNEMNNKPIGEMSIEEIVKEYKDSVPNSITREFILVYLKCSKLEDECPEIYL